MINDIIQPLHSINNKYRHKEAQNCSKTYKKLIRTGSEQHTHMNYALIKKGPKHE